MKIRNKLVSGILGIILIIGCFGTVADASNVVEIPSTEIDSVLYQAVDSNSYENWPQGPQIYSESGIVMDMDTGAILYAKNIDDQHYPASITKVATALIALQHYEMDEIVKFTWDDIGFLEYGDAHIGIKEGEELVMEDAMYGMMLASANEVSHAIGAHMEGGFDRFIQVMNETTKKLGCTNSHWVNTYGLHDPEHYTSVHDMALIGSAAFKYDKFREIVNTYKHVIPETVMTNEKRYVHQNHKMIREGDSRYYECCVGGKTGYTDQALTTLVTFATKNDMNLVAVVMRTHGGGNNAYKDSEAMLEYAFNNFARTPITKNMFISKNIKGMKEGAYLTLPAGVTTESVTATKIDPVELGDKLAKIQFSYQGKVVGTAEATITDKYYNELHDIEAVEETKKPEKDNKGKNVLSAILTVLLICFGTVILGAIALVLIIRYKRKQLQKRRRMRRMQYLQQRSVTDEVHNEQREEQEDPGEYI